MPTVTIYTINGDLQLLNAILNGVASICSQVVFIWGFALLASLWRITSSVAGASLTAVGGGQGGAVLSKGSVNAVMPFFFALILTNPAFQTKVQVESTVNGTVTAVDHVPFAIAVIPAGASILSQELGGLVETAYQNVGTDYASISASGNGFINPLKVLLTSRTAILRAGSIDSQIRSVVNSCLATDAGIDYGLAISSVMNAGNTGASAAQSIDINGVSPTAIGALLWQASQNNVGLVPDIITNSQTVLSCSDAAVQVANNITAELNSSEFPRLVQGAVNGMDQPIAGADMSFARFTQNYTAMRTANTTLSALAGGANQANAEAINLLFSELTNNNLNCLKAEGSNKTVCLAATIQANEIERNNIQSAANEVPMLKYAGSFANYLVALIIGLGPVIVLFMMFSGVEASKSMKLAAHIMIWPLLAINVGSELVNGMIYMTVANFMKSLTQGGYLSQAVALEAYKQFSLQIGTASHLMASLPILMSTIFALQAASTLNAVAKSISPDGRATADAVAPSVMSSAPLLNQKSMASVQHGDGGAVFKMAGAVNSVASSGQFQSLSTEAVARQSKVESITKTLNEGKSSMADWKQAFSSGDYSKFDISKSEGNAIKKRFEDAERQNNQWSSGKSVDSTATNGNETNLGMSGGASLTSGLNFGVSGQTGTKASDQLAGTRKTAEQRTVDESKSLSKAIEEDIAKRRATNVGHEKTQRLEKSVATQKVFQDTLTSQKTTQSATDAALKDSSSFVALQGTIGNEEMVQQLGTNSAFRNFQALQGFQVQNSAAAQPYLAAASQAVDSGSTDQVLGNPQARAASIRHNAMVRMAADEKALPQDRFAAVSYLTASSQAMLGASVRSGDTSMKPFELDTPKDRTGVDSDGLIKKGDTTEPKKYIKPATKPLKGNSLVRPATSAGFSIPPVPTKLEDSGVKAEVAAAQNVAKNAGVDGTGNGTAVRSAANVLDNGLVLVRPSGSADRTHLGNLKLPGQEGPPNPTASGRVGTLKVNTTRGGPMQKPPPKS